MDLPSRSQKASGRAVASDAAGRRDVIGGDRVAEEEEDVGVADRRQGRHLFGHAVEERRPLDVRRLVVPRIEVVWRRLQLVPRLAALLDARVHVLEHAWYDELLLDSLDLAARRVYVAQEYGFVIAGIPQRLRLEVDVDRPWQTQRTIQLQAKVSIPSSSASNLKRNATVLSYRN